MIWLSLALIVTGLAIGAWLFVTQETPEQEFVRKVTEKTLVYKGEPQP
jgi:hypothetical protein